VRYYEIIEASASPELLTDIGEIDPTSYGGWITPQGKVYSAGNYMHSDIVDAANLSMNDAFVLGWVRYVNERKIFSLEATQPALAKTMRRWLPVADEALTVTIDFRANSGSRSQISKIYRLPWDRSKMLAAVRGPRPTKIDIESFEDML
jgi:hypothetical protein